MTVFVLVPEGAVPSAVADAVYAFNAANHFLTARGCGTRFDVKVVSSEKEICLENGLFTVSPDLVFCDAGEADLIIVPAIAGDIENCLRANQRCIQWLTQQYAKGAQCASLCTGAFILAASGLLNGKSCSTHWMFADLFRKMYPKVTLMDDRMITEQDGIYTSGGAHAYWNLLLYLIEKNIDAEVRLMLTKFFVLDGNPGSQSAFMIFQGQRNHHDNDILSIQDYIEDHYREKISVNYLAQRFCMSRRTLERRFKRATQNSVAAYVQRVKVEASKKALESGAKTVNEVMYDMGYCDGKAFREMFKKMVGLPPSEYRRRFAPRVFEHTHG